MKLYNADTHAEDESEYIYTQDGIRYTDKLSIQELISFGYYPIADTPTVFDYANYHYAEQLNVVGDVCIRSWVATAKTPEEIRLETVPLSITMLQARKALRRAGLFDMVNNAVLASTDEELKDEWEYALEVRRDWVSLVTMAKALGMTDTQLDELFILAATL